LRLNRGGHDALKVFAAYQAAVNTKGPPTVILAKTVKGFGLGKVAEGQMIAHQQKKLDLAAVRELRDRFNIPVSDQDLEDLPFRKPAPDSDEMRYLQTHRKNLGGYLPQRKPTAPPLTVPPLDAFKSILEGTAEREISTTMAFVRILTVLLKDKGIGKHIVPIVPDEARTFGMEGLFRQIGIYSAVGQLYTPVDAETLMSYREDRKGQMLEEGINEAGSTCSWIAAATSYANHGIAMVPFYVYYSMFGFQRVGDFIWAAGDMRARGFLVGATAGRTTLAGEGLQHQDGHSQLVATTIPNCRAYDPTYAYELAVIIQDGMQRMYVQNESVFYYISVMNENYPQPALPAGAEAGIVKGGYLLKRGGDGKLRATLLGSGTILRECLAAAELLEQQYGVMTDVFSITSFSELRREALECQRWNLLHPSEAPRVPYVQTLLAGREGALVAATDYVRNVPDQIRSWVPQPYVTLGTDGFGRSDARAELRQHFEVDRNFIALAALRSLADAKRIERKTVIAAVTKLGIDADKADPLNS
jgi:pyruvate dehydrogenase E1 component